MPYPTYVNKKEDLPPGEHFAILVFSSVYVPGDERSRTNPGHGYPAYNQPVTNVEVYATRELWEAEINKRTQSPNVYESWTACVIKIPNIVKTVKVEIG